MCSVTWLLEENGYQVFFNRDEQKNRPLATPPQSQNINNTQVLMPIDPVGNGSWISLNEHGLSLCLLNNYQGKLPSGACLSRGLLLQHLAPSQSRTEVTELFNQLKLSCFAPFTLLVFGPDLSLNKPEVWAFSWNGVSSKIAVTDSPLFSSGVALEEVQNYRKEVYTSITSEGKNQQSLLNFHSHHHAEKGYLSTCMHRDDAQTVSFTHLAVSSDLFSMSYLAGSPCDGLNRQQLEKHCYTFDKQESLIA
ncbi:NRDE family protein [Vibrio makurazakiensis]|uniref:NRDE family protein n=1 Tax=Vibrio makurazakiensis TaxID=2910250 RepID=UPI003D126CC7